MVMVRWDMWFNGPSDVISEDVYEQWEAVWANADERGPAAGLVVGAARWFDTWYLLIDTDDAELAIKYAEDWWEET